jgi:hypothetical protein
LPYMRQDTRCHPAHPHIVGPNEESAQWVSEVAAWRAVRSAYCANSARANAAWNSRYRIWKRCEGERRSSSTTSSPAARRSPRPYAAFERRGSQHRCA